jgi:hypothetical protein
MFIFFFNLILQTLDPQLVPLAKHNLNGQIKEDAMDRACSTKGESRNAYRILVGESEGKRPLGRPRRRWVNDIKIDLSEIGWMVLTGSIWLRIGTTGGLL